MVTIKDIAKRAGVAQGTVSNVLNGKGNVSSEKIKAVYNAAHELGYIPNERASSLRKGSSKSLSVIMPDTCTQQYEPFYASFKAYALEHGFQVIRQFTNEHIPESEADAISEAHARNIAGIACISTIAGTDIEDSFYKEKYLISPMDNILFIDRKPRSSFNFIGFNYRLVGKSMAKKALDNHFKRICVVTGSLRSENESGFYNQFIKTLEKSSCAVTHIETDTFRKYQNLMRAMSIPLPEAFFTSNFEFAECIKNLCQSFGIEETKPVIYTISPIFTMPEYDFQKFEINYSQLGMQAAKSLIQNCKKMSDGEIPTDKYLKCDGFKNWYAHVNSPSSSYQLNVLTLKSPEAYIMKNLSRLFTRHTGIDVNLCILSYDEMYETFNNLDYFSYFDILRLDVTWLSWFAERLLMPLTDIDPNIKSLFAQYIDGIPGQFTTVNNTIYTLPATPSTQILLYRKDLFEDAVQKRLYWEKYKSDLKPPESFVEFNRIASFFTKTLRPSSPIDFGATMTMGSTGVAGSEYLARLFSYQQNLYDDNNEIHLDSERSIRALTEMVELKHFTSSNYCPWWTDTAERFSAGQTAMALLYTNYSSGLFNPGSALAGKIGYSIVPGRNPLVGGGSLGISKDSAHPDGALSFIKWMCSEPIASSVAFLGSTSPCKSTFDNYEILHNYPWLHLSKTCFKLTSGRRLPDHIRSPFDERKFLSIIGTAARNAYCNVTSPAEALKCAQLQFEQYFPTKF